MLTRPAPRTIRVKPWMITVLLACVLLGGPAIVVATQLVPDLIGKDRPGQRIEPYVGTWLVHGSSLEIRADLTGETVWNAGPCRTGDPSSPMCTGRDRLRFEVTSTHAIGTVVSVAYTDERGAPVPEFDAGPDGPKPGNRFRLTVVAPDVLEQVWDPAPAYPGNPYRCGPNASPEWRVRCNA
ncbi:hypothetical protein Val02_22020 [Virgisporangium aliadipatigenens]|uniref:Uncharacterized protein n=1 Tax=Virgisporangium aliadipatigenens TaxID=741659 RepID=A0A8J3YHQ6_9ACTN|nr:hypothetical protein [Virgisporangium aliadipatigenens]GIJ45316.1 hypothetical protein Val02_22020 [Virgisporangium aliadipatigenens]